MSVRVGIIGVGIMGADHARVLASHVPGAVLQTLYDADPARGGASVNPSSEPGAAKVRTDWPARPAVSLIEGDGIGPEITRATLRAIEAAGGQVEWQPVPAGMSYFQGS